MKGKCSNERGITLSSNFRKLYERMINERAKKDISITYAQAGGKKGSATVDHLLILRELENIANKQNKRTYMAFLDVTKAYDTAWSEAIMFVMHKQGIKDKHWRIIKKLNENLAAKITTKYGETRKIQIKDSIRQGGVLSVLKYGVLMDEINKDIKKNNRNLNRRKQHEDSLPTMDWRCRIDINIPGRTTKNAGHNKPNYQEIPHRIRKSQTQHNEKRRTKHQKASQTRRYGTWNNRQIQVHRTNNGQQR